MKTIIRYGLAVTLLVLLCGCERQRPFPSDYTAFPITKAEAEAKLADKRKKDIEVLKRVGREYGIDLVAERKALYDKNDQEWTAFVQQMRQGDELWFFSSSKESWGGLSGQEGYAVVRKSKAIDKFLTCIN